MVDGSFYGVWQQGAALAWPSRKVVCVGRNYLAHAQELDNPVPTEPLIFNKPSTSLVDLRQPLRLPAMAGPVHFELELALLIGQTLTRATAAEALQAVVGYGLALDLTLRDQQSRLKSQGHPWELAKAFDGSCPISPFIRPDELENPLAELEIALSIDGLLAQKGQVGQMIFAPAELLAYISQWLTLQPGDIVLTGTPAGVGPLQAGQSLILSLNGQFSWQTQVQG